MTTEVIGTWLDGDRDEQLGDRMADPGRLVGWGGRGARGVDQREDGRPRRVASASRRAAVLNPAGVVRCPVCATYAIVAPWWLPKPQRRPGSTPPQRSPRISKVCSK